jgi:hypothetical protein
LANRSAIFSSNVPGGPQNIVDFAKHPYDVYFIDSSNSNASDAAGYGNSPDIPLASIDYLFSLATAGKKVVGYVLPGHTETYSTTGTKMTADKAGVDIIGLGNGSNRPTITFGHTGATWAISAANITIANILFVTSIDSVVTYGTISGADFKMIDCEWRDTTDIEVITDWTITGDRPQFINCNKSGYTGGDANVRCLSLAGVDGALIKDCNFITKVTTAVIGFVTTACTNTIIDNCKFGVNGTTDYSKNVVDTITGSTWLVTKSYDIGAGAKFSGGSGGALAGDDVGAVATAVSALQTDLGDVSARTNLKSILAMLGNPDAAGATSHSTIIGTNASYNAKLGTKVTKAKADILDGTQQALFTVSGGRVLVTHIELEVNDAAVDAGANNTQILTNPTVGTDAPMCAVLDVDADEAGTIYSISGKPGDAMVGGSGGGAPGMEISGFVVPEGTIDLSSAADGGVGGATISAELWYIVLDSGASVASA